MAWWYLFIAGGWTGIGTIGTVINGILLFNEPINAVRVLCIVLILAGIAGLKFTATA
jgi:quaternary ammonium compound-resistance protein SugE